MARRDALRASDSDREDVAERLRAATAEGRLLVGELEQRLERVFHARTYGELDALVVDLPAEVAPLPARRRPSLAILAWGTLALGVLLSVLAAAATSGYAGLYSAGEGGPPPVHGRPNGLTHAVPAGPLALITPLIVIVFLVVVCAALGWLFSQDTDTTHSAANA